MTTFWFVPPNWWSPISCTRRVLPPALPNTGSRIETTRRNRSRGRNCTRGRPPKVVVPGCRKYGSTSCTMNRCCGVGRGYLGFDIRYEQKKHLGGFVWNRSLLPGTDLFPFWSQLVFLGPTCPRSGAEAVLVKVIPEPIPEPGSRPVIV